MAKETEKPSEEKDQELVGLLAQFDDPDSLLSACNSAREAGYVKMDAYTPFPVHGIDPALGIKRSFLPFIVLGVGLTAVLIGLGLQFYTNGGEIGGVSTDQSPVFPGYQFKISGKPYFSLPANIPVTFEIIVLSSAFATFFGMWIINRLPRLSNPLHRVSRFKRVTNDKFFLMIEAKDDKFKEADAKSRLEGWGAVAIEEVNQDLADNKLPSWMAPLALIGALLLLVPPIAIFSAYGSTNRKPRLHVVPDMDWQHKFKTQVLSPNVGDPDDPEYLFANRRAMRQPVEGSVAFDSFEADSEMYRGIKGGSHDAHEAHGDDAHGSVGLKKNLHVSLADDAAAAEASENLDQWITGFPKGFEVTEETLARGQQRFNIYCSVCHGYAGNGDGLVNQRAEALAANGQAQWTAAKSLHDPEVSNAAKNPTGRIFDTISNGRNTMGPYRDQISVQDRWAIVAYVKALQETGIQKPSNGDSDVDEDEAEATPGEAETSVAEPEAPAAESAAPVVAPETPAEATPDATPKATPKAEPKAEPELTLESETPAATQPAVEPSANH